MAASTFVFALLRSSAAVAQVKADEAREHYRRGTAAYNLGKYAEAAHEYEMAYGATLDPALLFNVAQAYRLAGDRQKALTAYRSYVRSAPEGDKRELAEARIKEIETALNYEDPFMTDDRAPALPPAAPVIVAPEPAKPPMARLAPALLAANPPVEAPPPVVTVRSEPVAPAEADTAPIYKRWWFWAAGAAVAVAIVVAVVAASGSSGVAAPHTALGTMRF